MPLGHVVVAHRDAERLPRPDDDDELPRPRDRRVEEVPAQHHEVLAIRLYDPREKQLPDVGMVLLEDAETGEQLFVDTHDKKFRKRFAESAQKREMELNTAFRHAGVDVLSLSTEDDLVRQIVRFAKRRQQMRR